MSGHEFWKRVDILRDTHNEISVRALSDATGLKYQRLKEQRSDETIPKAEDIILIAEYLDTTVEFLLTGKEERIISIADEVYEYMQTEMPSLLEDIMRKISLKKEPGSSVNRA